MHHAHNLLSSSCNTTLKPINLYHLDAPVNFNPGKSPEHSINDAWAVREVKLHWENMHMDYCDLLPILEFIDNMKIRHELAILDRIYMDDCYSISDREKLKATSQMQSVKNALELEEKGELLKIRMGLG